MKFGWIYNIVSKIAAGAERYVRRTKAEEHANITENMQSQASPPRRKSTGRPPKVFDVEGAAGLRGTRHRNGSLLTMPEIAARYGVGTDTLRKHFDIFDAAEAERQRQADILARETAERQRQQKAAAEETARRERAETMASIADYEAKRLAQYEAMRPKPVPPPPPSPFVEPVTNAAHLKDADWTKFFLVNGTDNLPHATKHEQPAVSIARWDKRYRDLPLFANAERIWIPLDPTQDNADLLTSIAADRWIADKCVVMGSMHKNNRSGTGDQLMTVYYQTLHRWASYEDLRLHAPTDATDSEWTAKYGFVPVPQEHETWLIDELTKMLPTQAELNHRDDIWDGSYSVGRANPAFGTRAQRTDDTYYDGTPKNLDGGGETRPSGSY
jgi:hypothetical protein